MRYAPDVAVWSGGEVFGGTINATRSGEEDVIRHGDEIEVNLSVVDSHDYNKPGDLAAKLSIHLRKGTGVFVYIPIPLKYLADDNFTILEKHKDGKMTTPEDTEFDDFPTTTYMVNGKEMLLRCYYNEILVVEAGGEDLNNDVIDELLAENGDGINYEIWFYFDNKELSREALYGYLNSTKLEFACDQPAYYINAFEAHAEGKGMQDCTVKLIPEQACDYVYHYVGSHLNKSDYNHVYVRSAGLWPKVELDAQHTPTITCSDEHHPHMIDLGLPSGTKWACCNVGASSHAEYGEYFQWVGPDMSLYTDSYIGHMPSYDEAKELIDNCPSAWGFYEGVAGRFFVGPNGNQIFFPATGYKSGNSGVNIGGEGNYWTTQVTSENTTCDLQFDSSSTFMAPGGVIWGYQTIRTCGE